MRMKGVRAGIGSCWFGGIGGGVDGRGRKDDIS